MPPGGRQVQCNHCGHELKLRAEFCPNCGQHIIVSMDDIIASTQEDRASRIGESLTGKLRVGILVMIFLFTVLLGFIYLYDKPLLFDGGILPGFQANANVSVTSGSGTLEKPYVDPRPQPPIPPAAVRALGYRRDPIRTALNRANGGPGPQAERAIDNALAFLQKKQDQDGGWPVKILSGRSWPDGETGDFQWGRVGVSGLVLLAFFGDGHTWLAEDLRQGEHSYADSLRRGIKFLIASQDPETGRFGAGQGERVHFMYNHGMATLALAEACALSGDAELKARVEKAVAYLVKTQTSNGGWNYYGHQNSDDISVSVWQVQALVAAREAGVAVPDETLARAAQLFKKATKGDRVVYRLEADDNIYTPSLAGMALMMRPLLGEDSSSPELKVLAAKLDSFTPVAKKTWGRDWVPSSKDAPDRAKIDPYMLYYCTYGMFFLGGAEWEAWNKAAMETILSMQAIDGSWRLNDINTFKGGTCYSTALCVLTLQVHHRIVHSISFKRPREDDPDNK